MGLSWNAKDGIIQRAIKRGLARRIEQSVAQIGVGETSFRKRHNYVTSCRIPNRVRSCYVGEDRKKKTLTDWYESLTPVQLAAA